MHGRTSPSYVAFTRGPTDAVRDQPHAGSRGHGTARGSPRPCPGARPPCPGADCRVFALLLVAHRRVPHEAAQGDGGLGHAVLVQIDLIGLVTRAVPGHGITGILWARRRPGRWALAAGMRG